MASATPDFSSFRFSTENLPPAQRLPMWHDIFGRSVSRRMLSLLSGGSCDVDMTVRTLACNGNDSGACVQRMFLAGRLSARRTPELLSDGNDDIVLHVHKTGRRIVSQLGRQTTVDPGGGVLTSNADVSTIVLPDSSRFVSIGLPRKRMMALVPGLEDRLVQPLPADSGILRLLTGYLDLLEDGHALSTPEVQGAVATHIQDLCALAIGATRDAAEIARGRGVRAARLHAIKTDIARNLENGDLSAATLALRQRVSRRYIDKLFAGEGTTLSKYVLGLRLGRVHRMLTDPCHAHRRISTLVFDAGFGDLSYFNREFRRCYGAMPSDVRAMTPT